MISLIIFSKNRPLQLDLCLKSLNGFDADYKATVIYSCDPDYAEAYETLKKEHPSIGFWMQSKSLFKDVYTRVVTADNDYVCFLTDDCLFYRRSPLLCNMTLDAIFEHDLVGCYSLRLGENITHRGTTKYSRYGGEPIKDVLRKSPNLTIFTNKRGMICYDRTQHLWGGYWNYPFSVDGHIFRKKHVVDWMEELCYLEPVKKWRQTPNELEGALQRFLADFPPFVACDAESCLFNSPNNRVQNSHENDNGSQHSLTSKDLLELFNKGKRINILKLQIPSPVSMAHIEIDLMKGIDDD